MSEPAARREPRKGGKPDIPAAIAAAIQKAEDALLLDPNAVPENFGRRVSLEATVAGSMILDAQAIQAFRSLTSRIPTRDLFASSKVCTIVEAILELDAEGTPADFTTVCDRLARTGRLEKAGGAAFVVGLEAHVFSTVHAPYYVAKLVDHWRRDQAILAGETIKTGAVESDDLNQVIATVSDSLRDLVRTDAATETFDPEAVHEIYNQLFQDGEEAGGLPWYWSGLARNLGPVLNGTVVMVVAPPGTGKTALAQQQMHFLAAAKGKTCLAVLMESNLAQIVTRHAMQRHGVDGKNINARKLTADDVEGLAQAKVTLAQLRDRMHFAFPGPVNGDEVDAIVQRWKAQNGGRKIDFLVVDHFHKMTSPLPKVADTDVAAMSRNFFRIAQIAVRENCPVLLLGQMPKEAYQGKRRMPTLGDVKGCAAAIEGAKQIVFLHYLEKDRLKQDAVPGHFVISKSNDGSEGVIPTIFLKRSAIHIEDTPKNRADYAELLRRYRFTGAAPSGGEDEDDEDFPC